MKIALYIEDGLEQIVLTPETKVEANILAKLDDGSRELTIKHGSFYACQGGWVRHAAASWTSGMYSPSERRDDQSTILVLREGPETPAPDGGIAQ